MATKFIADPDSFGFKLGRGLGWIGAQTTQRGKQLVESTGDFGRNVSAGAQQQYGDTKRSIALARAEHYAAIAGRELAPQVEAPAKAAKPAKAAATAS